MSQHGCRNRFTTRYLQQILSWPSSTANIVSTRRAGRKVHTHHHHFWKRRVHTRGRIIKSLRTTVKHLEAYTSNTVRPFVLYWRNMHNVLCQPKLINCNDGLLRNVWIKSIIMLNLYLHILFICNVNVRSCSVWLRGIFQHRTEYQVRWLYCEVFSIIIFFVQ